MSKPSVCGRPESPFGFGTLAPKEPHLLVQQADEHRAKDECEHPKDECKKRGNLKVLPGKRQGNHPDRGDQRRYEQDREKKDAEENQKRLEVSKDRATSHAGSSIDLNGQNPSAGNRQEAPVCGVPQSPDFGPHAGAENHGKGAHHHRAPRARPTGEDSQHAQARKTRPCEEEEGDGQAEATEIPAGDRRRTSIHAETSIVPYRQILSATKAPFCSDYVVEALVPRQARSERRAFYRPRRGREI